MSWRFLSMVTFLTLAACSADKASAAPADAGRPAAALTKLVLAQAPAGAVTVNAAKAAGPAAKAVVSGRVASIVTGFAVFTLMDAALPYCGETNKDDDCKTPWDYCCETSEARTANSLLVEVRGADGKPIATQALPDIRLLDAVTVTGTLTKDDHGNSVLLADGLFRRERPQLPTDLRWPQ